MHLIPFYAVEPKLAADETRVMHLFAPHDEVPPGHYGMIEFYCPDPACECRRVMLNVVEEAHPRRFLASISYGFDREDKDAGPFLDPLNPQCSCAEQLLRIVDGLILSDSSYVARLERHCAGQAGCFRPQPPCVSRAPKGGARRRQDVSPAPTATESATHRAQ
jgi:hypothetical protein